MGISNRQRLAVNDPVYFRVRRAYALCLHIRGSLGSHARVHRGVWRAGGHRFRTSRPTRRCGITLRSKRTSASQLRFLVAAAHVERGPIQHHDRPPHREQPADPPMNNPTNVPQPFDRGCTNLPMAVEVAREFWRLMVRLKMISTRSSSFLLVGLRASSGLKQRNAFAEPQRFARMNQQHPAHRPWRFTAYFIVGSETEAVSDVAVTDGAPHARAI